MIEVILLIFGEIVGYFFYILDCLLYALYLHPEDETSRHLLEQLKQRRYRLALTMLLQMNHSPKRYIHKSAKFLLAFAVLGIFVVTSTTSKFAHGLIVGFGVYIGVELWKMRKNPGLIREKFLWDLSVDVKDRSVNMLLNGLLVLIAVLGILALL